MRAIERRADSHDKRNEHKASPLPHTPLNTLLPTPFPISDQRHDFLADASTLAASSMLASQNMETNKDEQHPLLDGYESDGGYSSDGGGVGGGFEGGGGYGDFGGGLSDDDDDFGGSGAGEGGGEGGVAPISLEDAFRDKPPTYEDLCRSHIVSVT